MAAVIVLHVPPMTKQLDGCQCGFLFCFVLLLLFNLTRCLLKCIRLMEQIVSGNPMHFQSKMKPGLSVFESIYCFKGSACASNLELWKWMELEKENYNVVLGVVPSLWLII